MSRSAATAEPASPTIPRFLIAMRHPTSRRYVSDLIEQHCRCWIATTSPDGDEVIAALDELRPDALLIEASLLNETATDLGKRTTHLVVIGPQPDDAYRDIALRAGADAWISRDQLATQLVPAIEHLQCDPDCQCGCHRHPASEEETA
jgi:DNA-binding NarL/FixJ family response regulator